MKLPKKLVTAALLVVSIFATGCGSQMNIGYVDGGKVMEAPQIKAVIEEGEKKAEEIQNEAATAIENNPEWTEEEQNNALMDFQRRLFGINQAYSTQLKYKFDEALDAIAKEKQLDVIVDSSESQPIIFMGGVDVTEDVVKKLQ